MRITDIDVNAMAFGQPTTGFMGGQFVGIRGPIVFQTPRMNSGWTYVWVPHGAPESAGKKYWYMSITDPTFDDFITRIENRVLQEAFLESESWFGGSFEPDVIRSWFTGSLFGEEPKSMRFLAQSRVDFFDAQNSILTFEDLPRSGQHPVAAIVTLEGIWFRNRAFGLAYKLNQVKYYPETTRHIQESAFLDDDDES